MVRARRNAEEANIQALSEQTSEFANSEDCTISGSGRRRPAP